MKCARLVIYPDMRTELIPCSSKVSESDVIVLATLSCENNTVKAELAENITADEDSLVVETNPSYLYPGARKLRELLGCRGSEGSVAQPPR